MSPITKEIMDYYNVRANENTTYEKKRGNLIIKMEVAISPELVTWIMGWHKYVKVLEPLTLINEIKDNASAINKLY